MIVLEGIVQSGDPLSVPMNQHVTLLPEASGLQGKPYRKPHLIPDSVIPDLAQFLVSGREKTDSPQKYTRQDRNDCPVNCSLGTVVQGHSGCPKMGTADVL